VQILVHNLFPLLLLFFLKSWSVKGPDRHHFQTTHAAKKIALNLYTAIESLKEKLSLLLSLLDIILTSKIKLE